MYVNPLVDADLNKLSKNEQESLDESIAKYAFLSYDEIKEIRTCPHIIPPFSRTSW